MHAGRGDQATGNIIEALAIVGVLALATIPALSMMQHPAHDTSGHEHERQVMRQRLEDVTRVMAEWCCPLDPSAPSKLHDAAMQAWAGDEETIEQMLTPFFDPRLGERVQLTLSFTPQDGGPIHRVPIYNTAEPRGETVGTQRWTELTRHGPAYVVPRLENVTASAASDFHFVPISHWWPYNTGLLGEHEHWLRTKVAYDDATTTLRPFHVHRTHFTELAGTPSPLIDVSFREPDWVSMLNATQLGLQPEVDSELRYRQVLTKEDLIAERLLDDAFDADTGKYPLHRFHVDVNVTGPGEVAPAGSNLPEGTQKNLTGAYKLDLRIPRDWDDVQFEDIDRTANTDVGWYSMEITELPGGSGHRVTALLNVTANYTVSYEPSPDAPARYILERSDEIHAPFRVHARPPADGEHESLGFQEVSARVSTTNWTRYQEGGLTLELSDQPGRVHRTVQVHAPRILPPTDAAGSGDPDGVPAAVGATLLNGGEGTELKKIVWKGPEGTFIHDPSTFQVLADFGTEVNASEWSITADGRRLVWEPASKKDGSCDALSACAVAARVLVDGTQLTPWGRWRAPASVALYEPEDVDDYVDWFVESKRAYEGVLPDHHQPPTFAMASKTTKVAAGEVPGGFLWRLPPSSSPACNEGSIHSRNQPSKYRSDGRTFYRFGPAEDGVPVVGNTTEDALVECGLDQVRDRNFTLVAQSGDRSRVESIGKTSYRAVPGLSNQMYAEWSSGLAESRITGPGEVRAGQTARFLVALDSLFETLVDQGVQNVTLRTRVLDPYNAWEDRAWVDALLAQQGEPHYTTDPYEAQDLLSKPTCSEEDGSGDDDGSVDALREFNVEPEDDGGGSSPVEECQYPQDTRAGLEGRGAPGRFFLNLSIPRETIPGTHLLVVEASWRANTTGGGTFTETGSVVRPFDVLTPHGDRTIPALVEGLAWKDDWP